MNHIRIPLQDEIFHLEFLYESTITGDVSKRGIEPIELCKTTLGNYVLRGYCMLREDDRNFIDESIIDVYSINHKTADINQFKRFLNTKKSLIATYQDFLHNRAVIQSFKTPSWLDGILYNATYHDCKISYAMLVWDENTSNLYTDLEEPQQQTGHQSMAYKAMLNDMKSKIMSRMTKPSGTLAICREHTVIDGKQHLIAFKDDQGHWSSL